MAQQLMWLMLITMAIGMYLMNEYVVVKVQPIKKEIGKELFRCPSPISSLRGVFLTPLSKKFL